MQPLEMFQQQLVAALTDTDARCPTSVKKQTPQGNSRRFDIYRNNRAVSLIDNIKLMYPAVLKLVGDDFFSAAARIYIDVQPPQSPVMAEYGDGFGEFLCSLPGAQNIQYVADVAKIEWARNQSSQARDDRSMQLVDLAHFPVNEIAQLQMCLHPSVRIIRCRWKAGSIWSATIEGRKSDAPESINQAESVVVVRPELDVQVHIVPDTTASFLLAMDNHATIEVAATAQLSIDSSFDTGQALSYLISLGVFANSNHVTD